MLDPAASTVIEVYVNNELAALLPYGVVTTTLAVPAEPAGVTAVIEVELTTTTDVAAAPPIVTPVAPVNPVPVMVTAVPPAASPVAGDIPDTVGGATYVYNVLAELLPAEVVTTTLDEPAACAPVTAVIVVALTTTTDVAATPPIVTPVTPVKFVPVIVTAVEPVVLPVVGDIPVTVGGFDSNKMLMPVPIDTPVPTINVIMALPAVFSR